MNITLFAIKKKQDIPLKILQICQKAFEKKIFMQIICPNSKGVEFVDDLLWGAPFLPHSTQKPLLEPIYITEKKEAEKPFTHLIWLCKEPPSIDLKCTHIYDFDDGSEAFKTRYHHYKAAGYKIALL